MKHQRKLILVLAAIIVGIYLYGYIMKTRESMSSEYDEVYNKLAEEKPIYAKNNKGVEQFFNDVKEYKSNQMPHEIITEDQRQRRMLALPMGMKNSPLNNN